MNVYKLGALTLLKYIILSIISWMIVDPLPKVLITIVFIITSIISIILWYKSIEKALCNNIKDGVIITLFFVIPYVICILLAYETLFINPYDSILGQLLWTMFSNPMRILFYGLHNSNFIYIQVIEPFLIIISLFILRVIINRKKYSHIK